MKYTVRFFIAVLLLLSGFQNVPAQTENKATTALTEALLKLESDIRRDTQALNEFRAEVEQERIPLATELERLRDQVAEQRERIQRARDLRTQGAREQEALLARAKQLEDTSEYLRDLFSEYTRSLDTQLHLTKEKENAVSFRQTQDALKKSDGDLFPALDALLELALNSNEDRLGGVTFSGYAVDEKGIEHEGHFLSMGPASYFSATDQNLTGLVIVQPGSDQAGVYSDLKGKDLNAIDRLIQGERAFVPIDAMGGKAIQLHQAQAGLIDHIRKGGITVIPLFLVALAAICLSIWKFLELRQMEFNYSPNVDAVLTALETQDTDQAKLHAQKINRPLQSLIHDLIEYKDTPREHLEEILQEHVLASLPFVERNLSALAVLGGVAPLLGLLGTVTGMIHTFDLVTLFGSGDAKLLSGGISEALVTTEIGLIIAIPTLLIHAFLSRRARSIIASLDAMSSSLVNHVTLRKAST